MMMLQALRLDSNLLEELPTGIGELYYLEELTFADNKVTEVPAALFAKLSDSLKILIMADNKIKHLP
jgi:Leucine-rich repeat (LRR) protein